MNASQLSDWEGRFDAAQEAVARIKAACEKLDNKLGDVVRMIEREQPLDPLVIINLALNESQALDRLRAEVKERVSEAASAKRERWLKPAIEQWIVRAANLNKRVPVPGVERRRIHG